MKARHSASTIPPGWVDLQVNGYAGVDFSRPGLQVGDIRRATEELVRRGTAAYCPTIITSDPAVYEANLPVLARAMEEPDLQPHLLGIHMEGPFISAESRGAHLKRWLLRPDIARLDHWMDLAHGRIVMLTLAPELEGCQALVSHAASRNVLVSLGHHLADDSSIQLAVSAGACCCTHLGNGIPNMLPRHPNPIWSQLAEPRLTAMLITDGHHLPADFIRVALRAKGVDNIVITSDVAPIAGLPPGEHLFAGTRVISEPNGRISVKGENALAGSSATLDECIAWLRTLSLLSEQELMRVGRLNPLRLLGIR